MKKIGFLSLGHWTPSPQSETGSAADALLQSIDLAVETERLGMDGAYLPISSSPTARCSKTISVAKDKGTIVQSVMAEIKGSAFCKPKS